MAWKKDAPPGTYSIDVEDLRKIHDELTEAMKNRCPHIRIAMPPPRDPSAPGDVMAVKAKCRDCGDDTWAGTPVAGGTDLRPGEAAYFMDEESGHTMTLKRIPEADEA